jgi:hypothetical protein
MMTYRSTSGARWMAALVAGLLLLTVAAAL